MNQEAQQLLERWIALEDSDEMDVEEKAAIESALQEDYNLLIIWNPASEAHELVDIEQEFSVQ